MDGVRNAHRHTVKEGDKFLSPFRFGKLRWTQTTNWHRKRLICLFVRKIRFLFGYYAQDLIFSLIEQPWYHITVKISDSGTSNKWTKANRFSGRCHNTNCWFRFTAGCQFYLMSGISRWNNFWWDNSQFRKISVKVTSIQTSPLRFAQLIRGLIEMIEQDWPNNISHKLRGAGDVPIGRSRVHDGITEKTNKFSNACHAVTVHNHFHFSQVQWFHVTADRFVNLCIVWSS